MTPAAIRTTVVTERAAWIRKMMAGIRGLPLSGFEDFVKDPRNIPAAESYLRRGLEALLDLGRHILAKGFGLAPMEYKEIASQLVDSGVLSAEDGETLRQMAGYRNRLVHFYHEVSGEELFSICTRQLKDVEHLCDKMLSWLRRHPERLDTAL